MVYCFVFNLIVKTNVMEVVEKESKAFEFIKLMWNYNHVKSRQQLYNIMQKATNLAIESMFKFDKVDFIELSKLGRYTWFGCNSNGKGTGEMFYCHASACNNTSAMISYEHFAGIKPFIFNSKRVVCGSHFKYGNLIYVCTGFNELKEVTFVAYDSSKYVKYQRSSESGVKKLFKFNNSEWLEFRRSIVEY